jgi:ubiquinone/menaquinone biosynthesis C-methylase UbiE
MKKNALTVYRCPINHDQLELSGKYNDTENEIVSGILKAASGREYNITDGIPDFTYPEILGESDSRSKGEYDRTAEEIYDNAIDWLFQVFYEDEELVREKMADLLGIYENSRVLEIGCGTGRDTVHIAQRLSRGEFYVQDLSSSMVKKCMERIQKHPIVSKSVCNIGFSVGNAAYMPFPDKYFDAAFHFGAINEFSEKKRAFEEITRVVRTGGKVVVGDESMAPWLRQTEYGKTLINNNHLLEHTVALELLPQNSHEVCLRYILGNSFYLIDYVVGDGTPAVNLDLPHKGGRGGTPRTRYFGQLEGVNLETKQLAERAAEAVGLSMHDWLDKVVRHSAEEVIRDSTS